MHDSLPPQPKAPFAWLEDHKAECPRCGGDAKALAHDQETCLQAQVDELKRRVAQLEAIVKYRTSGEDDWK